MKRITAMIITLAMLAGVTSCNGNTAEPANTTVGEGAALPAETTAETTAVTEGTVTEAEPALPKFDINSEECLMYRLLDMTVEEIEAEFGEMTLYGIIAGGTPCYQLADLGILFYFQKYSEDFDEPLPRDMISNLIEAREYDGVVYPGIYLGMDSKELIDMIGIEKLNYSIGEIMGGYISWHNVNGKSICIRWELPEEDTADFINVFYNGDREERAPMLDDIAAKMKTGEIKGKVLHIIIF